MTDDLGVYLAGFRRRKRLRDGWHLAQRSLWLPAIGLLLLQIAGRFWPIDHLDEMSLLPFTLWLIALILWSVFRPLSDMRVALKIDQELKLRERLSTAVAFDKPNPISDNIYTQLIKAQHQDAIEIASSLDPSKALPLRWMPRPLSIAAVLILMAFASAFLPNRMDIQIAQRQSIRQEAARQAERVEQLRQQIEQSQELSPEERQELMRQLAQLAEKLRANRGDIEQSMADISNLEKQLVKRLDANRTVQQANLEALAARLEALTGAQRNADQSAAEAAAQALANLSTQLPDLSAEQQQELARELAQMAAQASQSGDAELAKALAALAQAVQQGDAQAAQQASQGVQHALSQAQARLAEQNAIQQAIDQLQSSRQALAQAAQQAAQQAALAQGQMQSQNAGLNAGQNPGQAAGQPAGSQGQPGGNVSGGGTKANTLPPATGGRGNVRPQGEAPNVAPGDLSNQVYAPWQRPDGSEGELSIPGQETGQGETQTRQGQSNIPGASNPALVPYQQVYNSYLSAANQALQQSYVPAAMSEYIRQYFSQLNP
jgi:septal ring factor EnvC (AmiA/AmiB activator)